MKTVKQSIWAFRKKIIRWVRMLKRAPRATGMIGLSEAGAEKAYGSRDDVTVQSFFRKSEKELIAPKCLPEDQTFSRVAEMVLEKLPDYEVVLLESRNSAFTFQYHHLLDDDRRVIYEPQMHFEQLPIKDQFLVECKKLEGTIAYLANTIFCQYGHWLQRQLPMLLAYWEVFGKETIDYYYVGDGEIKGFAEESLLYLGIRKEQIVSFPCRGDRALICMRNQDVDSTPSSQPCLRMDEPSYRFLEKNLFQPRTPMAGKRLFVMRGEVSGRRELNLAEVQAVLEPLGFEFVGTQGLSMQQEADLFGNAEVVVAVHGAALHNLLFARPGTKVVEIFPYDYSEESNYVIANHGACDYFYLIGAPVTDMDHGASLLERNRADVIIDIEKLIRLLEQAEIIS